MRDPRRRFSRRERRAMWLLARGRCIDCGARLPQGWHGDHLNPWSKDGPTHISNGAARCPSCNAKKGADVADKFTPFDYQAEVVDLAMQSLRGERQDDLTAAHLMAGAGKSPIMPYLGVMAWREGLADKILTITPRVNLCQQADLDWQNVWSPLFADPKPGRYIHVRNEHMAADRFGHLTTAASLLANPNAHLRWAQHHEGRFVFGLDEAQFYGEDTQAAKVIQALHDYAAHTVVLTGWPYRADGGFIIPAEARYIDNPDESGNLLFSADVTRRYLDLVYETLVGFEFHLVQGVAETLDLGGTGEVISVPIAAMEQQLRELVMNPSVEQEVVDLTITKLKELRRDVWPGYQGLIVCERQDQVRRVRSRIESRYSDLRVVIAISDDDQSLDNLRTMRAGRADVLVTCDMAYVGFDSPPIKVIGNLSADRVEGRLIQTDARALRFVRTNNIPIEQQCAWIIAPGDPAMRAHCERMRSDAEEGMRRKEETEGKTEGGGTIPGAGRMVIGVELDGLAAVGLDPDYDLDQGAFRLIEQVRAQVPELGGIGATALAKFMNVYNGDDTPPTSSAPPKTDAERIDEGLSQQAEAIGRIMSSKGYYPSQPDYQERRQEITSSINRVARTTAADIKAALDFRALERRWSAINETARRYA